jgi:hypothetical protein
MNPDLPRFAVVGHPNKGKSSIVATLAQDPSVRISPIPGTTTERQEFPMRVDGKLLYTLFDTPGFQRARAVLDWLRAHETDAASHPLIVRSFVAQFGGRSDYRDECELLQPIVEGAGIIYVTDGSRPYGREYEAEMEILRWTGQPSLALINPIRPEDHIEEWRAALGQYFRIVRVFSAWEADFNKHIDVLRAFAQLNEAWRGHLDEAVEALITQRELQRHRSAHAIAEALFDMLTLAETKRLHTKESAEPHQAALNERLLTRLRKREAECRRTVEAIYHYGDLERDEQPVALDKFDLFAKQSWALWGLSRDQIIATGALGGALAGAGIDLAVGGASLMLGAAIGSVVGGVSSWLGFGKLAATRVLGLPLGGQSLTVGPIKNVNFPFVVLGRALFHHHAIASRTHAQRDPLALDELRARSGTHQLPAETRKALAKCFQAISSGKLDSRHVAAESLSALIRPLLDTRAEAIGGSSSDERFQ